MRRAAVLTVALVVLACAPPAGEDEGEVETEPEPIPPPYTEATLPADSPPSAGTPGAPSRMDRPAVRRRVVMIEGMPDTVELRLVETPASFPVQFSTYVPADMDVQIQSTEDGHSLEMVARFGGVLNERAYVQFYFYPRGTTRALARTTVESFVAGLNPEVDRAREVQPYPWASEQIAFTYPHEQQTYVGSIALAQRGSAVFHYVEHFPAQYADGMAPRIRTILTEWRWQDGSPLMQP